MSSGRSGGGGMGGANIIVRPITAIFWITVFLSALSISLAAAFSQLAWESIGAGLGIISSDLPEVGASFEEGQRAAGGTPDESAAEGDGGN